MQDQQLRLDAGGEIGIGLQRSYAIGGKFEGTELDDLPKGADVSVTIADADGVVIAAGRGRIREVAFREHEKDAVKWTERAHKIRLADADG